MVMCFENNSNSVTYTVESKLWMKEDIDQSIGKVRPLVRKMSKICSKEYSLWSAIV